MSAPVILPYGGECQFIGCPVVFQITPTGSGVDGTFYRVKLKVRATMTGGEDAEFDFSNPVDVVRSGSSVSVRPATFDVSSALRAVAERWQPQPEALTYPAVTFYLEAKEEWMVEGQINHSDIARYPGSTGNIEMYIGKLTDRERMADPVIIPARYTRKPATSPEVCFYDENHTTKHLYPGHTATDDIEAPSVTEITVPVGSPTGASAGINIYGIPFPKNGYEIRFINSLGVHENIFVSGLPSKEGSITTDKYAIARQETLTQFSRGLAVKQNDRETWRLTSGALDRAWASWYVHEFLMAQQVWIKVDGMFIPCHVLPEETVVFEDPQKSQPYEVQFRLEMGINGSPIL